MARTSETGWKHLNAARDDHSRIGFVSAMPDPTAHSAGTFLQAAVVCYQSRGVTVKGI